VSALAVDPLRDDAASGAPEVMRARRLRDRRPKLRRCARAVGELDDDPQPDRVAERVQDVQDQAPPARRTAVDAPVANRPREPDSEVWSSPIASESQHQGSPLYGERRHSAKHSTRDVDV